MGLHEVVDGRIRGLSSQREVVLFCSVQVRADTIRRRSCGRKSEARGWLASLVKDTVPRMSVLCMIWLREISRWRWSVRSVGSNRERGKLN